MKFSNPYAINLLWLLFPVAGVQIYGLMKRKKILNAFANISMQAVIIPGYDPNRRWIKLICIIVASGLAIFAMAGPQWGFRWEKVNQKGVDIMIALDCSKSMLAQDIKPNRLERAKREIVDLLNMLQSDRAGLVAFSGQAILQCPLTLDHQAFHIFLNVLEPGFLPIGGTNLEAAVQSCYQGFEKNSDTQKAIILITDGEGTTGKTDQILEKIVKEGIKIFTIGVGEPQGAPIPDESGGFKKDKSGNIILSKVDEAELQRIAAQTGGAYVRSVAGDMDLDLIYKDKILGTMEKKNLESGKRKIWENRYQWFLFPALIFFFIEFILLPIRKTKNFIVLFFICFGLFVPQVTDAASVSKNVRQGMSAFEEKVYDKALKHFIDAQLENPDDRRLYYNIGTAAYMDGQYELAKQNFTHAANSKDVELRHNAIYNLANTQYKLGHLDDAIAGYEKLLKEFPDDVQAKENLEFVKRKKEEQKKNPPQKNQENTDENKEKKDQSEKKEGQDQNKSGQQKQNQKPEENNSDKDDQKQPQSDQQQKQSDSDMAGNKNDGQNKEENQQNSSGMDNDNSLDNPQKQNLNSDEAPAAMADNNEIPDNKNMEKMLNRLQDKPGRAMIPIGRTNNNGKDW